MGKKQFITRKGSFDSGHRVMNEHFKCFNIHGHTYLYELTFSFNSMEEIGYAIDFKEIKRVMCQWIDDYLDHGMILNPHDSVLISTTAELGSKMWLMSLNGINEYCNPSVENIAKEICIAIDTLTRLLYMGSPTELTLYKIKIYETPNCFTTIKTKNINSIEMDNFLNKNGQLIMNYAKEKGVVQYDDRKINN